MFSPQRRTPLMIPLVVIAVSLLMLFLILQADHQVLQEHFRTP